MFRLRVYGESLSYPCRNYSICPRHYPSSIRTDVRFPVPLLPVRLAVEGDVFAVLYALSAGALLGVSFANVMEPTQLRSSVRAHPCVGRHGLSVPVGAGSYAASSDLAVTRAPWCLWRFSGCPSVATCGEREMFPCNNNSLLIFRLSSL